jgi:hypothetical protein
MRDTPSGSDPERAPAKTGTRPGDTYDGRKNSKAGTTDTPLNTRDATPRVIRWSKTA